MENIFVVFLKPHICVIYADRMRAGGALLPYGIVIGNERQCQEIQ